MAAIRPCTGTTADWKAVEDTLILKEREVGVEIDTSGHYLVRQGDGKNKFFDLPIIVNNARYEEILELTQGYMNTVNNFSKNMTEATNSAKDTQEETERRAENDTMVVVKLENIADDIKDIKRESRENREEMKQLRERVVIVEQSLKSYHKRLDGEQHSDR